MWSDVISIDKGFGKEIEFLLCKLRGVKNLSFAVEESRDRIFIYLASACELAEEVEEQVTSILETAILVFMKQRCFLEN